MKVTKCSHTPGPWWVDNRRPQGELQIQAEHRGFGSSYCVATVNNWEDHEANARLIAAAPELLASLKEFVNDWTEANLSNADTVDRAQLAIAKAEGKS